MIGSITNSKTVGYTGAQAATVGTTYPVGKAILINCTVAGTITVTMDDGTSAQFITTVSPTGSVILPLAVTAVTAVTGTSTVYILY